MSCGLCYNCLMSFEELNEKQKEAVEQIDGPLLILAGAGSGKTNTMTHRIAHMVELGIAPWRILAVTFTNKAAAEMRTRVEDLIGRADDMWIMTFHAMCLRILRIYPEIIGYEPNFVIYDTTDQKSLVRSILKENGINEREFSPQYLLSVISDCKEKEISPEDYRGATEDNYRSKAIYMVYSEYQTRLRKNNAMDFDDILLNCVKLFEKDEAVLDKYQERFKYIMVDEYQDTNHIQYKLVRALAEKHQNICVVGDDDQCIYQWRGADIRNILDFENDFPRAKVIKLEQNYRSKGNILAAAHSVISHNKDRKRKELWTEKDDGEKIKYIRCDSDKDEAQVIARQIMHMENQGRRLSDIAILYRTNAQSRLFESALSTMGVPYRVLSGMRYYDRKEVKDVMAYMRLVVNPRDDLSLRRVINEPKRGMGDKTVDKIATLAQVRGESLFEALCDPEVQDTLPGKAYDGVKSMVEAIESCRAEKDSLRVSEIYDRLLVQTGYLKALENAGTVEAEGRIENLMEFKSVIYDYEEAAERELRESGAAEYGEGPAGEDANAPGIEGFMEQLTLAAEVDNYDETQDTVTLMTMHSAKGLEFPVVFMPGMEDGLFPGNKAYDSVSAMEEERRLCYVGMTRAKDLLYLSSASERMRYGRMEYTRESQFMRELDKSLLEGDAVYQKREGAGFTPGVDTGSYDGATLDPYKPFDSLKYARMATKTAGSIWGSGDPKEAGAGTGGFAPGDKGASLTTEAESALFAPGDKVIHKKFGEGTVIEGDEKTVTVIFDSEGVKKLAIGMAPLKKL